MATLSSLKSTAPSKMSQDSRQGTDREGTAPGAYDRVKFGYMLTLVPVLTTERWIDSTCEYLQYD